MSPMHKKHKPPSKNIVQCEYPLHKISIRKYVDPPNKKSNNVSTSVLSVVFIVVNPPISIL